MGRIRILPDEVANKIAAGEVVERPASVVKELLENSLDAGATEVRIEVAAGGRRLVRVADDGCGMGRDDALLAFERHATSKLREARDLLAISSLGFRGEALPSIAAVSRLTLETRAADEPTGTRVEVAGGRILRVSEIALAPGTAVAVRDLFYNMPARRKFLRSEQTELAHIASLVTQYSLAYPEKSFSLRHEARTLLEVTPVARLRDRVYQVFGSELLEELVDLGVRERALETPADREGRAPAAPTGAVFRLRGFVSQPHHQRPNRNSIYLFVNRRLIRDRLLMHALLAAYRNLAPPDVFPFALLFLECDPSEVDVNVHPAKTEVRFRHSAFVHDFVCDAVREALAEARPVSAIPLPAPAQPAVGLPYSEYSQHALDEAWRACQGSGAPLLPQQAGEETPWAGADPGPFVAPERAEGLRLPLPETHRGFPPEWLEEAVVSMANIAELRPLGQIRDSFIVAAGPDGLWLVDQHVAHERILFEKFLKRRQQGRVETQSLLTPLILALTPAQQADYERIAAELQAAGFEIEPFGGRTIAVKAAPAGIPPADLEKALLEVLEPADEDWRRAPLEDLRRRIAAALACRAAIKINTPLETARMEWLLRALAAAEHPMSCPHGRPTVLRYPMREILRAFRRI
ncbi:MAG: DNA mismatch repair endonuclease MutL [Bryobacterales bacterium]|nr:DNA mismatch repair endonuclease MutL [Bryobacteraceae bacterium]MDW8129484.1 DNA mismatch repair endonuclease MutL [Bryobacterales bacterium]